MSWSPLPPGSRIFLVLGATDLRKSFNTLAVLVDALGFKVYSGDCFVFCNRRKNLIKCLYFLKNGFCIWQKRLDQDRFQWPKNEDEMREIDVTAFRWLLDGFHIDSAHKSHQYSVIN